MAVIKITGYGCERCYHTRATRPIGAPRPTSCPGGKRHLWNRHPIREPGRGTRKR